MKTNQLREQVLFGQIRNSKINNQETIPLQKTTISGQITGRLASICVTQIFSNFSSKPCELEYLLPLPETAAITDFEIRVGSKTIHSEIEEIEQARKSYNTALQNGQRAGLFEIRRANLFAIHLANVLPSEEIHTTVRFQDKVTYNDGSIEFVYPMGITPKYISPDHPVNDLEINPPIASPDESIGPVEINLSVDAGSSVENPTSPSHEISYSRIDNRRFNVTLASPSIPDHDFVLRYKMTEKEIILNSWTSKGEHGDYFYVSMLPPSIDAAGFKIPPREFIFILDRSGSMSGEPIAQAKNALRACLRTLNTNDHFYILLFDDHLEWYKHEPASLLQSEINAVDQFLDKVDGRGGTEILPALEAALKLPQDLGHLRTIVFLTDGAVSVEDQVYDLVRQKLQGARLFTFGIGPSVNRALLNRIAKIGKGTAEFLQLTENIEDAIVRFQDRIAFPLMMDIRLKISGAKAYDLYPEEITDLYAGQTIDVLGRIPKNIDNSFTVQATGMFNGGKTTFSSTIIPPTSVDTTISHAWAKARLDHLLEETEIDRGRFNHKIRDEIISLALEHHLVSPYTALVAIDELVVNPNGIANKVLISQPLPEGLSFGEHFNLLSQSIAPMAASPQIAYSQPKMSRLQPISDSIDGRDHLVKSSGGANLKTLEIEEFLRNLTRTQRLNGSWNDDIELTAVALVAFIRHGHSISKGVYRHQVRKAFEWLNQIDCPPSSAFYRAWAFYQMASKEGKKEIDQALLHSIEILNPPDSPVEKAIMNVIEGNKAAEMPSAVGSIDELRLAAIADIGIKVSAAGIHDENELFLFWKAAITDFND